MDDNYYLIQVDCHNCGIEQTGSLKIRKGVTIKQKLERAECKSCGCTTLIDKANRSNLVETQQKEIETLDKDNDFLRSEVVRLWQEMDKLTNVVKSMSDKMKE